MVVGDAGGSARLEADAAAGLVADLEAELRRAFVGQTRARDRLWVGTVQHPHSTRT